MAMTITKLKTWPEEKELVLADIKRPSNAYTCDTSNQRPELVIECEGVTISLRGAISLDHVFEALCDHERYRDTLTPEYRKMVDEANDRKV